MDEDSLIEEIMAPYPTARLRARRHREAKKRFSKAQAEQWRRQDATKCNTLQQNATVSASATSETEDGRGAEQRPSLREMQHIATECNESSTATVTSAATSPRAAAAANQQKGAPAALQELERWERKRA